MFFLLQPSVKLENLTNLLIEITQGSGQDFMASIVSVEDETITLDFNHPLAGQELTFDIELVSIT